MRKIFELVDIRGEKGCLQKLLYAPFKLDNTAGNGRGAKCSNVLISVNYDSMDSVGVEDECSLCLCCTGCVRECASCTHGGQEEATESLLRVLGLGGARSYAVNAATEYMKKEADDEAEEDSNEESEESEEEDGDSDDNFVGQVFDNFELVESEDD